jgi:hypothetical protein
MGGYSMKREEEIRQMANVYTKTIFGESDDFSDITDAYIYGAKWANETIIAKACEWLNKTLYIYTEINHTHCGADTIDWVTSDYNSVSDFIDEFLKVLEE